MARAIGIDPGTVSFDVCGRDGERVFLDETLPTPELAADPGRLVRLLRSAGASEIRREVTRRLSAFAPVRRVEGYAAVAKEAAQGAALIGQGLMGGPLADLVEAMGLRDARGSVLDHLFVGEAQGIRRRYRPSESVSAPFWERS